MPSSTSVRLNKLQRTGYTLPHRCQRHSSLLHILDWIRHAVSHLTLDWPQCGDTLKIIRFGRSYAPALHMPVPLRSLPGRRSLRSTSTNRLLVPPVMRSTVLRFAFLVAGPNTWNALPEDVTSSQSEYTFHLQLKTTWLLNFSRSVFYTSSSDTDCILTFSLGLFVPTLWQLHSSTI